MSNVIRYEEVRGKIVQLRGLDVMLDYAVAELYGVETRVINQAVKNNPEKFPLGYVIEPDKKEFMDLRSKFLITISPMAGLIPKPSQRKVSIC